MSHIQVKDFLGKFYPELFYSSGQEKYKESNIDQIFGQKFLIQNNKVQMVVDPSMPGLSMSVSGNEIYISKELYDHPNVIVVNSIENGQAGNSKGLYNPETFSTVAYLVCQNHTTLQIVGEIDEPIYVKYKSDFETFYHSVIVFDITNDIEVEIVEEIESQCALNAVANYLLHPSAVLKVTTFYQNNISALSFFYRNVIAQDNSKFSHIVLGKGSSNILDENRIRTGQNVDTEFLGVINSNGRNFHSVLSVEPMFPDYTVHVDYRDILSGKSNVTFYPVIVGQNVVGEGASISVTNITTEELPAAGASDEIKNYISDIVGRAILERIAGAKRFYDNKSKFMHFP